MPLLRLQASRVVGSFAGGSTRPLLVDTDSGRFVVKLVHGPEGPLALAAEYLCSELATAAGLPVLQQALVAVDPKLAGTVAEDELREAVARGAGACFGVRELPDARVATPRVLDSVPDDFALPLLWFDVLVQNPDRRVSNPNILSRGASLFAIDHAACLSFHRHFSLTEQTPSSNLSPEADHVFALRATRLGRYHAELGARLSRERLESISLSLPEEWLGPLRFASERRQRLAYAAYLWKRLRAMDAFLGSS